MYIINTSDGTCIAIESGVYAITNGETNVFTEAQGFNNWLLRRGLQAATQKTGGNENEKGF